MSKIQFEIQEISKDMLMLRYMEDICFEKAEKLCEYIKNTTKVLVYWYNNTDTDKLEIYVMKSDFSVAKRAMKEFDDANESFKSKAKKIIEHRHKK